MDLYYNILEILYILEELEKFLKFFYILFLIFIKKFFYKHQGTTIKFGHYYLQIYYYSLE